MTENFEEVFKFEREGGRVLATHAPNMNNVNHYKEQYFN